MSASPILVVVALVAELAALRLLGERVQGQLLLLAERGRVRKLFLYALLAPGVALHEAAHATAAVVSGAGVAEISLFHPRRSEEGIVLGYVQPKWQPRVPGGALFLALAPLLLPPLFLYLLATYTLGATWASPGAVFATVGGSLSSPTAWLWLFLFASMSLSNFPSNQDFRSLSVINRWIILPALGLAPLVAALTDPGLAAYVLRPYLILASFLAPSALICLVLAAGIWLLRE